MMIRQFWLALLFCYQWYLIEKKVIFSSIVMILGAYDYGITPDLPSKCHSPDLHDWNTRCHGHPTETETINCIVAIMM
jgi:hypothetical protein